MFESREYKRVEKILDKKTPSYRKAYSDRLAWLMAYMAQLAYLNFDKPNADAAVTLQLVKRALKGARKGTTEKIVAAISKSYSYDYQARRRELEGSLTQIGWQLVETISVNATQAYIACNEEFAVLAFRGTEADRIRDIKADAKATQTTCPTGGRVHSGFKEQYDDVACQVEMVLNRQEIKGKPLFITGHSLGGAVAAIATRRLNTTYQIASCYTYGSPRVGTEEWVAQVKTPFYRIVNSADPVPTVPLSGTVIFLSAKAFRAIGRLIPWVGPLMVSLGNWLERTMSGYAHAGNMRFLTNCKDGDFSKAELLYTVGWGRRFLGVLSGMRPWGKVLKDHGIAVYREKLLNVVEKRNV